MTKVKTNTDKMEITTGEALVWSDKHRSLSNDEGTRVVHVKQLLQKAADRERVKVVEEVYTKLINLKPEKQDTEWQIGATDTLNQVRRFLDSLTDTNTKEK